MKTIPIFIFFFLSATIGRCQNSSDKQMEFPEYVWLNKKIPLDTLISFENDTIVFAGSEKHYLISFWYSYCPPCIAEMPWLNQLKSEYSNDNIEFIAITFENEETIQNFTETYPFDFKICQLEQDVLNEKMLTLGYPTNILVSKEGIVLYHKSGGSSDPEHAKEEIENLAMELTKLLKKQ